MAQPNQDAFMVNVLGYPAQMFPSQSTATSSSGSTNTAPATPAPNDAGGADGSNAGALASTATQAPGNDPNTAPPPTDAQIVMLGELKADLDGLPDPLEAAVSALATVTATAKRLNVDLDKPEALAQSLGAAVPDEAKTSILLALNAVESNTNHVQTTYKESVAARDRIVSDGNEIASMPKDNSPAAGVESKLGTTLEHIWDFLNHAISVIPAIKSMSDAIKNAYAVGTAIADLDQVKDPIKDLLDKSNDYTDAVRGAYEQTNKVLASVSQATQDRMKADRASFKIAIDAYSAELASLVHNTELLRDLVAKYLSNPQTGGDGSAGQFMEMYKAIDAAYDDTQTVASVIESKPNLQDPKLSGWINQLVPIGTLVTNLDRYCIFSKGGKNWSYDQTVEAVQQMSDKLGKLQAVTAAAKRTTALHDHWDKVLRSKMSVH